MSDTPACPAGSTPVPKSDYLHQIEWVTVSLLSDAIITWFTDGNLKWILDAIAPIAVNVDFLCANPPNVPDAFDPSMLAPPPAVWGQPILPNYAIIDFVRQNIQYAAFNNFCDCGPPPTPPAFSPGTGVPPITTLTCTFMTLFVTNNSTFNCDNTVQFSVNVTQTYTDCTTTPTLWVSNRNLWPIGYNGTWTCPPTDSYWIQVPVAWAPVTVESTSMLQVSPEGVFGPFDYGTVGFYSMYGDSADLVAMVVCPGDVSGGGTHHYGQKITATLLCGPPAPAIPPEPTGPAPVAPSLPCDSATLCAITWVINNNSQTNTQVNSSTNTTTTNIAVGATPVATLAPSYVEGATHSLTDSGTASLASGTLGLRVTLDSLPSWQESEATDPIQYFNAGWVVLGYADGWDNKRWLHYDAQLIFPQFPQITQFAWNLEGGVTATATELVPPPPTP